MKHILAIKKQRGVVMVVGLVMLLLLTLIGMAAIRGSTLEERMAGNMRDRNVAFQSAEAGLRAAEIVVGGLSLPSFSGAQAGYGAAVPAPGSVTYWENTFNWSGRALRPALGILNVNSQPQYYVELVKTEAGVDPSGGVDFESRTRSGSSNVFRITSRAEGGSADTLVILQSTFRSGDN